jgi:phenylacetic acid degradation protein
MANIYQFEDHKPVVHESAFIHPQAVVIGNVSIGRDVYIGPCAVLRGDFGEIVIEDGSNVQENCTVHMFPGALARIGKSVIIGHGAVIHGADIGDDTLVGMNSVVMDSVEIGAGCIVGALSFVPQGMKIPERKVVVGSPAKVRGDVTEGMENWKSAGAGFYQALTPRMIETLIPCEPLRKK